MKLRLIVFLLLSTAAFAQKVHLTWVNPAPASCGPATAINIYRSDSLGGEILATATLANSKIAAVTPPLSSYDDATVIFGQTKYYKATAWYGGPCGGKESVFSNEAPVVIPPQIIIFSAPTSLQTSVVIP